MDKHTLEILQHFLQDFESVFDHFGTLLCITGLTILAIQRGLFCNFAKTFKDRHFMGHNDTDLKFSITIDL